MLVCSWAVFPLLEGPGSAVLMASWAPQCRASLSLGIGCTEPKLTRSAGTQTALTDRIRSLSGGVGVWITHMTWHGTMPKILACIHVVCQLISLPKIWSATRCDVNTQHLLGEALDPAWRWPCWSSQAALCHAPQDQNIVQKSKILSVRRVPVLWVLTQHLNGHTYILCKFTNWFRRPRHLFSLFL